MAELQFSLNDYTNILTAVAKESLLASPVQTRTGRLLNSLQVTVGGTVENPKYILTFEDYGLFLDEGVTGTLDGITGQGYLGLQFKYSGRFKMTGGDLPYGARTNIYKFGLKPKPWLQKTMDAVSAMAAERIETDLPEDIANEIANMINAIPPIEIKA